MKFFGKKKKKDKDEKEKETTETDITPAPAPKAAAKKPAAAGKKPAAAAAKTKTPTTGGGGKTVIVELPKNYVAFVLPDGSKKPSTQDMELLKSKTIAFLEGKMCAAATTSGGAKLNRLELEFHEVEYGTHKPYERFNLFLVAQANVHYEGVPPERGEVFKQYISSFQQNYLDKVLRKIPDSPSLLSDALEVRARLLTPETPGGAVTLPKFYIAFQLKKEPTSEPSKSKQDQLLKLYNVEATRLLKAEYEDDFEKLRIMKITKIELGGGKPEPKYNLYIEFEAVANFIKNTPDEPMDLFRAIAATSNQFSKDIMGLGGPFKESTQMTIRCVYVQSFDLPGGADGTPGTAAGGDGAADDSDPKDKPKNEDDNEDGDPDDGDPEDQPKEGDEDGGGGGGGGGGGATEGTASADPDRAKVKMELGFYVALVMQDLTGMPTDTQMFTFDTKMEEFFSAHLLANFPKSFVDLKFTPTPQFEAGIPLPRFNLLHEYDVTINFYHPPPDGMEVLKKILYCDLSDLYSKIKSIPAPYDNMMEFTLRRALEKEITTEAYGGKLGLEEKQRRLAEEKAKKEAEERAKKEAEARAAAEKKRQQEEAEKKRKEAEAAKKAKEEAARCKREEEEKKRKAEEAAKAAAKKKAEEEAARKKKEAEEKARKEAEEKARREAEERARKEAEEKARKEKEAAAKKAAEEKRKKEEAEAKAKALAEKKRKEQEAAAKAAKAKAAKEAKEREEAERKRKEKEAAAAKKKAAAEAEKAKMDESSKSMGGSSRRDSITKTQWIPVESSDLYVALTMPNCKVEPTKSDYDTLAKATREFYHKNLRKQYSNFKELQVEVKYHCFEQNKPNDRYNVYLEWDIVFSFSGGDIPGRIDINTYLMNIDLMSYLTTVRSLTGTPFEGACGIYVQKVSKRSSVKM